MNIVEYYDLAGRNTFGFQVKARFFVEVSSVEELVEALAFARERLLPCIPLGGGSNVVLENDLDALVIAVNIRGCQVLERTENKVCVQAGAGENWHEFVRWTLAESAFGLENLSLIPGAVGAAPIQNIGAYGVELKDCFDSLEAINIATGESRSFSHADCEFGYRDSVFKNALRDQFIITSVRFNLNAALEPKLGYGKLREELSKRLGDRRPEAFEISEVVASIRMEKLPDPLVLGNAGSFFKNPVVDRATMFRLKEQFSDLVCYESGDQWKLAAGWLIDRAGMRGYRMGSVGTYKHQALVLVNHGGATGADLMKLAHDIQGKVFEMFAVQLEMEPRVY